MINWSDHALASIDDDRLERRRLVNSLGSLLNAPSLDTPLVIGIYGDWGSGKTSVMKMLHNQLLINSPDKTLCLWFDAWKFARTEHSLWRALLLAVIEELGERLCKRIVKATEKAALATQLELLRDNLFRSMTIREKGDLRVNWRQALPITIDASIRLMTAGLGDKIGISDLISDMFGDESKKISAEDAEKVVKMLERAYSDHYFSQITAIDQFEKTLSALVHEQVVHRGYRLIVFVDDLDRCLPEDAIAALEAIKLFFDMRGSVFVLGMDRDVIERGILSRFPPIENADGNREQRVDPRRYLDKIVQIPMFLPSLTEKQVQSYLDALFDRPGLEEHLKGCRRLIEVASPPNPRMLKRILNVLALLIALSGRGTDVSQYLAKIAIVQVIFDDTYEMFRRQPLIVKEYERGADGQQVPTDIRDQLDNAPALGELLKLSPKFIDLADNIIEDLIAQAAVTASSRM